MSFAQPPERPILPPVFRDDLDYQRGIRWSMGVHAFRHFIDPRQSHHISKYSENVHPHASSATLSGFRIF